MPKGKRETAEQRAIRELEALGKNNSGPTKPPTRGGKQNIGKPAVSDDELFQRQVEKDRKRLEQSKAAERKRIEAQRAKVNTPPPPPPTPRQQGQQAAQKLKQAVSVTTPSAPASVQKGLGFLSEFKPSRRGLGKTIVAAGAAALAYGGFKVYGTNSQPEPAKGNPAQNPAGTTKPVEPAKAPPTNKTLPDASKYLGMSSKDLENMFKKTQPKNRYTV